MFIPVVVNKANNTNLPTIFKTPTNIFEGYDETLILT